MINIYIPSMQRANRQLTLAALPSSIHAQTTIIVPMAEVKDYRLANPTVTVLGTPGKVHGIAATRQWILDHAATLNQDKIVMLDDDLSFAKRRLDDPSKFTQNTYKDTLDMFKLLDRCLGRAWPHVGVTAREGGNRVTRTVANTRILRVHSFHVPTIKASGIRYRINNVDDFDFSLQLLHAGHANLLIANYSNNQFGSNTSGGANSYRTMESVVETSEMLKSLHPEFVKVVTRTTKVAWGGGTRTDVQISWKKAYASSGATLPALPKELR